MTTIGTQIDCNSIDPFSEVLNNQNFITGAETKKNETTIDMHFNYDGIDCIAESILHNSSLTTEEKKMDNTGTIDMQVNSINVKHWEIQIFQVFQVNWCFLGIRSI